MPSIPEAVTTEYLQRWGREIAGGRPSSLGYPTRSTLHTAMIFHGPGSRSNVPPPDPEIDPAVWLIECIVLQIAMESLRKAAVLRAAFCGYGTWRERLEAVQRFLERSGTSCRMSRRTYFRLREEGIRDVGTFLGFCT